VNEALNPPADAAPARRDAPGRSALTAVFLAILLDLVGFGMILPSIPFYAQRFHATPAKIGFIFSIYSLAQLLFAPPLGRLSDRYGRRPLMLLSIAAGGVGYLLFARATSVAMLLVARAISGAAAANYGIAQAYIADSVPPERRSRAMGLVGAAFGLGFVLGPALGGMLARFGDVVAPYTAAGLSALNLAIAAAGLRESLPPAARLRARAKSIFSTDDLVHTWANVPLRSMMLLFFLVMFCFTAMESTLALYCQTAFGYGTREISWLFVYVGLLLVVVQGGLLGRLVKRFGDRRLILAGIALMAAGLLLLPAAPWKPILYASLALLAIGSGVHNPSVMALLTHLTDPGAQGETIGVSRSYGALARTCGPAIATWIFDAAGPPWPFWSAGGLMLVALALAGNLLRRLPPESA
jgi:MFS family permease